MSNKFLDELLWRGLIYQKTPDIELAFEKGTTLYFGIDPTGDSLHIGHLVGVLLMKRALDFNQKIILLMGGGTSQIGDPSGRDAERQILPKETIEKNKEQLKLQMTRFFTFDGEHVQMVDNALWLENLKLIYFLLDAGKYISVNSMLDVESVKTRLKGAGMSFAEFTYQLLQAYDFMKLFEDFKCEVQVGGSDQIGNIIQGVELIRKKFSSSAFGLSFPLIVNPKTGKKFGKTEKGEAIWLDSGKTHPFAFYQFLLNTDDALAPTLLRYFSFKTKAEIEQVEKDWHKKKEERLIQKTLAYEVTELVHGKEMAEHAQKVTDTLFNKESEMTKDDLEFVKKALPHATIKSEHDFNLEDALVSLGMVASKGEARRLVSQKGASSDFLASKYFLVRKGKKEFGVVEINP